MSNVSKRLKELRKAHKLSQKQVSEILGISESGYGYYEQGRNEPSIEMIKKLANKYDVSTDYLLGISDIKNPNFVQEPNEFNSLKEINYLLEKYEIDDMSFFDIEKWKSMSPEQIKELESYFQYLVQKSNQIEKK
ncbi:helix-turn-helix domain-containing protein [Halobacillus mangrovi]|uniref:helix-turn-helix domain-containing protein n=1 Tax=Halobacillus mangrovi TaxID=402384 RepID=UPI003D9581CD